MAILNSRQQTFAINGRTLTLGQIRQAKELGIDIHKDDFEMKELNPNYRKARDEAEKAEKKKPATKKVKPKTEEVVSKVENEVEPAEAEVPTPEVTEKVVEAPVTEVKVDELKASEGGVDDGYPPTIEEVAEFAALTAERAWLMNDKKARYQYLKKKLNK